jgi:hypothetical protein
MAGGMILWSGGGKGTAALAGSNIGSVITLKPTVQLDDNGGSSSFNGQIETVQASDLVSQILGQPGLSRLLVINGGGARSDGATAVVAAAPAPSPDLSILLISGYTSATRATPPCPRRRADASAICAPSSAMLVMTCTLWAWARARANGSASRRC